MKKYLIVLLAVAALLPLSHACLSRTPEAETPDGATYDPASVTLEIDCPGMEPVTRALDPSQEKAVHDLNVYFFSKQFPDDIAEHVFSDGNTSRVKVSLFPTNYDLYVIANAGRDMGEISREKVAAYSATVGTEQELTRNDRLPMSARQEVRITGNTSLPVSLVRCVARLELSLNVTEALKGHLLLHSVQLCGAARSCSFFSDNAPSETNRLDYPKQTLSGDSFNGSYYLWENMQGVNSSIADQKQKNRVNAPAAATCLHIEASYDGRKADYYIYPGANATSDFNIRRNTTYSLQVNILGISEVDTRVSTTELSVTPFPATSYAPGETAFSTLSTRSTHNPDGLFYLTYSIPQGGGTLLIDGAAHTPGVPFLFAQGGGKNAQIAYTQQGEGPARITFSLTDTYGFTIDKEIGTTYKIPYQPIEASLSDPGTATVGVPCVFYLSFSEPNYAGPFNVKYELLEGTGSLTSTVISRWSSGTTVVFDKGEQVRLGFFASEKGAVRLRFTVSDQNGQSKTVEQTIRISGKSVRAYASWDITGYEQHTMLDSTERTTYRDPCYLNVYAELSKSVSASTTVTVELHYTVDHRGFYGDTYTRQVTDKVSVSIPAGQSSGRAVARQYCEYCYIDNESYPHVLVIEGDRIEPASGEDMTRIVSASCSDPNIDITY